ncbi:MAG: SUF system Fe-S cluster assembly regulator [Rhodocyclaceae bacterium]|jgi:FeS assembly SUF system regulator|nr:SUF system Fe-S cluster assembly regulator [Rhodocyclaceae bacterium]
MLRISKLADYGTMVTAYMARRPDQLFNAGEIAQALHLGQPTVSKILKMLGRDTLVLSVRGAAGGYTLARSPELITVAEIIDAMEEQPFGLTECSAVEGACTQEDTCIIRGNWRRINGAVRRALEEVSLADMIRPPARTSGQAPARSVQLRQGRQS